MPNEQKVKIKKFYQNSSRPGNYVPNALVTSPPEYPPLMSGLMQINPETKDIWISAGRELLSDWINITAGGGGGGGGVTSIDVNGGTGISVSPAGPITTSGTFTVINTAPDLVVSLTSGTGIGITGVYPSFTISSTTYNTIQEDGSGLTSRPTVNFVGTGVTATDDAGNLRTNVTIPGITASEGLSAVIGDPNDIELGRSALAATADFSVSRFINSGTEQITLSGTREVSPAAGTALQNAAILKVLNTNTTTQSTVGIYAETVATYNSVTNIPGSAAIMGVAGGTGEDVVGIYGLNASSNLNSVAIRGQASSGIAGRFVATGNATTLITTSSSTTGTNGITALRAENTGSGDANKIIDVASISRAPTGVVASGGGAAITYELNAQGDSGIERPDVVRLAAYSVDLTVAPGSHKTGFRIEVMHDSAVPTERINFYGTNIIKLTQGLSEYADDAAAAVGGIPITGLYRTGSFIKIRVS